MCYICIMVEKSIPSPKTLIKASDELKLDMNHFEEVYNKILDKIPTEEREEYEKNASSEYYLNHFRNT